jgi:HEAT repeat protein
MRAVVFLLTAIISLNVALFAQSARPEILDRIRDYDLRHSDLLVKIVKDPETLRYAKVRALEKMSVLYRQSHAEGETVATRYLDGITQGLLHKSPDVREAACTAAIVFKDSLIAVPLVTVVAKAAQTETDPIVLFACAQSLAEYIKQADIIAPALLVQVERYLKDIQDSSENEKALKQVCKTLGAMKVRKSFIPLLKVLQSHYSDSVKRTAQNAIHDIRIEKVN